ncbi:hypothetical protein ElyMa_001361800 [Elysia marginata]|uniref:Uncharacterized protein n=1 Tax=Elysia marginata TaxID=1093978 RepID=A0AAV4IQ33_9GAST|nr:hypothetical protein ElyMa_001361800 [Elysia marginata]
MILKHTNKHDRLTADRQKAGMQTLDRDRSTTFQSPSKPESMAPSTPQSFTIAMRARYVRMLKTFRLDLWDDGRMGVCWEKSEMGRKANDRDSEKRSQVNESPSRFQ